MFSRAGRICFFTVVAFLALPALAANIVVNGSFESGLSGWTVTNDGTCTVDVYEAGDTTPGFFGAPAPAPTEGLFLVVTDPIAPGSCSIHQDVAIPTGANAVLTADIGYLFDSGFSAASGCSVTVEVTTPSGSPIATVFSEIGTTTNIPIAPQPALDLSAQAGSTVRVIATATSCIDAPVGLLFDNVVLDAQSLAQPVPVMPAWLLLMMATLLGLTGLRRMSV